MQYIFKCKTNDAFNLKVLAELLSNNIKVGHFVINEEGIFLTQMDTHRKILISIKLLADNFSYFKIKPDKKLHIGINLQHFYKMLKSIKKKDNIELFIEENETNKLGIKVTPKENNRTTTSFITIQSVQEFEIDLPKVESKPITILSSDFQKMIKDMNNIGTSINIISKPFNIQFSCETDGILTRKVDFGELDSNDEDDLSTSYLYNQNFHTEQLTRITKIAGLSSHIKIYQGIPILFKTTIDNLGEILIYIKSIEQLDKEEHDSKNRK
jgi:proliferating cell nuclear antigen PCNA